MEKEMNQSTLFINEPFALRQHNSLPVYTEIKTVETQRTESEVEIIVNNLNKQMSDNGLNISKVFDSKNRKFFLETPKRSRVKTNYPINFSVLKRIFLTPAAKGYISTAFMEFCKAHNVAIYWVDGSGKLEASFIPFNYKKPKLIMKQYMAASNGKGLEIAKYLVNLKLESQNMERFIEQINKAGDIKSIIRIEGSAQDLYYQEFAKNFNGEFKFNKRCGKNPKNNKNATDPINTMLNLGYSLLARQMSEILLKRGFELSMGFLHSTDRYWNQLSYDFLEPYRIWIDNCVKEMINKKEIQPDDFTFSEDKSHMVFKDKSLKIAIGRFMETLEILEYRCLPIIRNVEGMLNSL